MKKTLFLILIVVLVILGAYFYMKGVGPAAAPATGQPSASSNQISGAPTAGPGGHCGGNTTAPAACQAGFHCAPEPGSHLPFGDVGGICVPDMPTVN